MARVPEPYLTRAHHWLILHGRYVCVARRPKCEVCLIADLCPSRAPGVGVGGALIDVDQPALQPVAQALIEGRRGRRQRDRGQ